MARWYFNIAAKDAFGHNRKKEGDIISVKPGTATEWGKIPMKNALVVPVDGLTKEEAYSLCQRSYEGGVLEKDLPVIYDENKAPFCVPIPVVAKRRFSIPLSIIKKGWKPDLIEAHIRDTERVYQPLLDNDVVIDFSEKFAICKDNHTGKFKYAARKKMVTKYGLHIVTFI